MDCCNFSTYNFIFSISISLSLSYLTYTCCYLPFYHFFLIDIVAVICFTSFAALYILYTYDSTINKIKMFFSSDLLLHTWHLFLWFFSILFLFYCYISSIINFTWWKFVYFLLLILLLFVTCVEAIRYAILYYVLLSFCASFYFSIMIVNI